MKRSKAEKVIEKLLTMGKVLRSNGDNITYNGAMRRSQLRVDNELIFSYYHNDGELYLYLDDKPKKKVVNRILAIPGITDIEFFEDFYRITVGGIRHSIHYGDNKIISLNDRKNDYSLSVNEIRDKYLLENINIAGNVFTITHVDHKGIHV